MANLIVNWYNAANKFPSSIARRMRSEGVASDEATQLYDASPKVTYLNDLDILRMNCFNWVASKDANANACAYAYFRNDGFVVFIKTCTLCYNKKRAIESDL